MTDQDKEELKKEIEELRDKLNQQGQKGESLTQKEILELSKKLDELINQYYR